MDRVSRRWYRGRTVTADYDYVLAVHSRRSPFFMPFHSSFSMPQAFPHRPTLSRRTKDPSSQYGMGQTVFGDTMASGQGKTSRPVQTKIKLNNPCLRFLV